MLTRMQLLKMLVGLKKANDIDRVGDDDVVRVSCNDADREAVRAMTAIINQIYCHFDYANSPEFLERLEGKSEQVQSMHRKLLTAEKRANSIHRLGDAIISILDSDDAYRLIPADDHHLLIELKSVVVRIPE